MGKQGPQPCASNFIVPLSQRSAAFQLAKVPFALPPILCVASDSAAVSTSYAASRALQSTEKALVSTTARVICPAPPANDNVQSSTQSTTLKAAVAPAKCPRKYTAGCAGAYGKHSPAVLLGTSCDSLSFDDFLLFTFILQIQRVRGVAKTAAPGVLRISSAFARTPPENCAFVH